MFPVVVMPMLLTELTVNPVKVPNDRKLLLTTELANVVVLSTSEPLIFNVSVASILVTAKFPFPSTENPGLLKPDVDVSCFCITPMIVPVCNYSYIYSVSYALFKPLAQDTLV